LLLAAAPLMLVGRAAAGGGVILLFDGDSISAGVGATPGHGLDAQVVAALGDQVRSSNVAAGGRPVLNCLTMFRQRVVPLFVPEFGANIIVFHAGDNDIAQGRDAVHAYTAFTDYVQAAHDQGWRLVVSTELRRYDWRPVQQAQLEAYNDRLRQNRAGADAVVDLDSDPRLLDPEQRRNPDLFTADGVHPSDGGYAVLAALLAPAIQRVSSTHQASRS
jgi:lysophospholipase L1-like esterase